MNNNLKILCALPLLVLLMSCPEPMDGITPIGARLMAIPAKSTTTRVPAKVIAHVDLDQHNPLNTQDYFFEAIGDIPRIQLFDYVVLGHAYLVQDSYGVVLLQLTPALQHILDNGKIYLRPLREKGIKILIEIRSGNYADTDEGIGLGLGTMTIAANRLFVRGLADLKGRYAIDGFEFNDVGGGYRAYPPYTRDAQQFQSEALLYPDSLFVDKDNNPLSDTEVETVLWREGGNNLATLLFMTNEGLKYKNTVVSNYNTVADGTAIPYEEVIEVRSILLVKDNGHGGKLTSALRPNFPSDGYSGAQGSIAANYTFAVHSTAHDTGAKHSYLYNETNKADEGYRADNKYAPLTMDVSQQLSAAEIKTLADWYKIKTNDITGLPTGEANTYEAIYITNLPSADEAGGADVVRAYLTRITQEFFARRTSVSENGGNNQKTW